MFRTLHVYCDRDRDRLTYERTKKNTVFPSLDVPAKISHSLRLISSGYQKYIRMFPRDAIFPQLILEIFNDRCVMHDEITPTSVAERRNDQLEEIRLYMFILCVSLSFFFKRTFTRFTDLLRAIAIL